MHSKTYTITNIYLTIIIMVNEYNPNHIMCMFPTLFPFGIDAFEMNNRPMKVSLQTHLKHLKNLEENHYPFSKHHLFPFFIFNIIQQKQKCLRVKLTIIKHKRKTTYQI